MDLSVWRQLAATARLTRAFPRFARSTVSRDVARARVQERLHLRERVFLHTARRTLFANPHSPYRRLLAHAGCTHQDLARLVQQEGLDGALLVLARHGVYVTQAELKGRLPIVRGSLRFSAAPGSFDNPLVKPHFVVPTSGSSGRQLFVGRSLAELAEIGEMLTLALETFGVDRPAYVKWSTLPHAMVEKLHLGQPIIGWFNPLGGIPMWVRALQVWVWGTARASGVRIAFPRTLPLTRPDALASWQGAALQHHAQILIDATASSATRVSAAATARGLSLAGLTWIPWGEPLTAMQHQTIAASGAQSLPVYSTVETGPVAMACGSRVESDAMHLRRERFAVTPAMHAVAPAPAVGASAPSVPLAVTSLGPNAPKILLNAETGDSASFLEGQCGCTLDDLGLTWRIATIRSIEKLTGEGITLVGSDVVAIIDELLPHTYGGRQGDYQLVETVGHDGVTRLVLRVHPGLPEIDAAHIRTTVLDALAVQSAGNQHAARLLDAVSSLGVEQCAPWIAASGKVPAFVPLRATVGTRP